MRRWLTLALTLAIGTPVASAQLPPGVGDRQEAETPPPAPGLAPDTAPAPETVPAGTVPAGTVPAGTVPAGTEPAETVPAQDIAAPDAVAPPETEPGTGPAPEAEPEAEPDPDGPGQLIEDTEPDEDEDEPALPEGHRPELRVSIENEGPIRTGDLVHLVIVAIVPEGDDVFMPDQGFGSFERFDQRRSDAPTPDGRRQFELRIDLLALEPGDQELPALRVRVVTVDGVVGSVRTEAQTIAVGSHIANEPDAEPRPATQPIEVLEEDYTLAWVLGIFAALLLTALIAFFVGRWYRRRPKAAPPPPPPRPPWELALEQLRELGREREALLAEGRAVELVDRVSDIVREYLGNRFDFNGLESTSDEVMGRLRKVKLRRIKIEDVRDLLAESDLVKFARMLPDEESCDRMIDAATKIVKGTTPRASESGDQAKPKRKKRKQKPAAPAARIITKAGEVAIPLSVQSIDEMKAEIGAAVGSTARDKANDPSFNGVIRIALSPELRPSEKVDAALTAVHDQLADELEAVTTSRGRPIQLIIEHYHRRLYEAAADGEPAPVTIIDDDGRRLEMRDVSDPDASAATVRDGTLGERLAAAARGDTEVEVGGGSSATDAEPIAPSEPAPARDEPASAPAAEDDSAPSTATAPASTSTPKSESESAPASAAVTASTAAPRSEPKPERAATPASAPDVASASADDEAPAVTPDPGFIVVDTAFPEAVERVAAYFYARPKGATREPSVRWIPGLPLPIAYGVEEADGVRLFTASALTATKTTRSALHARALEHARRLVPAGFAPTDQPAYLDGGVTALLALPERVPSGETWVAYPDEDGTLVVMRESAETTPDELTRLEESQTHDALFDDPVRVETRGFSRGRWPSDKARRTDPGNPDPGGAP